MDDYTRGFFSLLLVVVFSAIALFMVYPPKKAINYTLRIFFVAICAQSLLVHFFSNGEYSGIFTVFVDIAKEGRVSYENGLWLIGLAMVVSIVTMFCMHPIKLAIPYALLVIGTGCITWVCFFLYMVPVDGYSVLLGMILGGTGVLFLVFGFVVLYFVRRWERKKALKLER